jgi:hypothetical protein
VYVDNTAASFFNQVFQRQVRPYPFQVVMRRFTLLIIPFRHEYLADNEILFVLCMYSALKPACQGLTKSEKHTAAHLSSIVTIFSFGVRAGFLVLHLLLYRNCVTNKLAGDRTQYYFYVCNMIMKNIKWHSRSGATAGGIVTTLSVGQPRNNGSIPSRDKRFFSSRLWGHPAS